MHVKGTIAGMIALSEFEKFINQSYQPKQVA